MWQVTCRAHGHKLYACRHKAPDSSSCVTVTLLIYSSNGYNYNWKTKRWCLEVFPRDQQMYMLNWYLFIGEEEKLCGKEFKQPIWRNTWSLLIPNTTKVLETEEVAKKSNHSATELSQTVLKQSKLLDCIQSKKYDPESRKHVALTRRLAVCRSITFSW